MDSNISSQGMLGNSTHPSHLFHVHLIPWHLCSLSLLHSFSLQRFSSVLSASLSLTHLLFWLEAPLHLQIKSSYLAHYGAHRVRPVNVMDRELRRRGELCVRVGCLEACQSCLHPFTDSVVRSAIYLGCIFFFSLIWDQICGFWENIRGCSPGSHSLMMPTLRNHLLGWFKLLRYHDRSSSEKIKRQT